MRKKLFVAVLVGAIAALAGAGPNVAFTRLADGFDYPVGAPNAEGYYKARGFRANGHLGDDWNGARGGDTDLGDPVYSIGHGVVTFAKDVRMGWGNVILVRHAYSENGRVQYIDSLYGHLDKILVREGQQVARGQKIGTIGTAHGQYDAHLHFEVRKNLSIGMMRAQYARDYSNYFNPSTFIADRRSLKGGNRIMTVAMNTYNDHRTYQPARFDPIGARTAAEAAGMAPGKKGGRLFQVKRFGDLGE
jgi:hypothetical protein